VEREPLPEARAAVSVSDKNNGSSKQRVAERLYATGQPRQQRILARMVCAGTVGWLAKQQ
jgi:hypothetical protein